jgi:hypothetical protein
MQEEHLYHLSTLEYQKLVEKEGLIQAFTMSRQKK